MVSVVEPLIQVALALFVDHVGNTHGRDVLIQVGHDAFVEAEAPFMGVYFVHAVGHPLELEVFEALHALNLQFGLD